jgi:hypothetical protein
LLYGETTVTTCGSHAPEQWLHGASYLSREDVALGGVEYDRVDIAALGLELALEQVERLL